MNKYTHKEIRALVDAATDGEWLQSHRKNENTGMYNTQVYTADGKAVATLEWYPKKVSEFVTETYRADNARFIAASRQIIPQLLDEVEKYREALEYIYEWLEEHDGAEEDNPMRTIKQALKGTGHE